MNHQVQKAAGGCSWGRMQEDCRDAGMQAKSFEAKDASGGDREITGEEGKI